MSALGLLVAPMAATGSDGKSEAGAVDSSVSAALAARAQSYWAARMADSEEVYSFYAPPEKGGPKSRDEISEGRMVKFEKVEIARVEVDEDRGLVRVAARISDSSMRRFRLMEPMREREFSELWSRIDGTWYRLPVEPGLSKKRAPATLKKQVSSVPKSPPAVKEESP
jgi:hypothetical protein